MTIAAYNIALVLGMLSITLGVCLIAGLGHALIVLGALILVLTLITVRVGGLYAVRKKADHVPD